MREKSGSGHHRSQSLGQRWLPADRCKLRCFGGKIIDGSTKLDLEKITASCARQLTPKPCTASEGRLCNIQDALMRRLDGEAVARALPSPAGLTAPESRNPGLRTLPDLLA